jgi:hypothetical protein
MKLTLNELKYVINESSKVLLEISNNAIETIIKNSCDYLAPFMNNTLGEFRQLRNSWKSGLAFMVDISLEECQEAPNMKVKDYLRLKIMREFHINRGSGPLKFLKGIVRICCSEEINMFLKQKSQMHRENLVRFKQIVNYIYTNQKEMDEDLNGLSFLELYNLIGREMRIRDFYKMREKKKAFESQSTTVFGDYTVVRISCFNDAAIYSKYTPWCVTQRLGYYDEYAGDGSQFYFCLKNGFKKLRREEGEGCPLDEYGLSMVSVCIQPDGEPKCITTRWNHTYHGEDNPKLCTLEQIEQVLGIPKDVFEPSEKFDNITVDDIPELLMDESIDVNEIFTSIKPMKGTDYFLVTYDELENVLHGRQLLFDDWFQNITVTWRYGMLLACKKWGEYFLFDKNWNKLNEEPFSYVSYRGGNPDCWYVETREYYRTESDVTHVDKENFVTREGKLFFDKWVKSLTPFCDGICCYQDLDGERHYINKKGKILFPNTVFQEASHFDGGVATVCVSDKWYILKKNGEYILIGEKGEARERGKIVIVSPFTNGFALILYAYGKMEIIDTQGERIDYEDFIATHKGFWVEDYADEDTGEIYPILRYSKYRLE